MKVSQSPREAGRPVGLSRRIAKREGVPEPTEAAPASAACAAAAAAGSTLDAACAAMTRATRPRPRPREPLPPARPAPPRISPGGRPLGMASAMSNRRGFGPPCDPAYLGRSWWCANHSHGEDILPWRAAPLVERRRAQTSTAEPQDQRSAHGFTAIGACEAANVALWR